MLRLLELWFSLFHEDRFFIKECFFFNLFDRWEPVIGLEVHAQINTKSKLFSRAPTQFGGRTNSQVALLDAAFPGTLPVSATFVLSCVLCLCCD
jgi:hypothetical protein